MIIEYLFSDMAKRQVLFSCQNLSCFLPSAEVIVPEGESGRFFADISTTILGIIYEKGIELNDIGIIHSDKKHMMMEKESLTMNWEYSAENRISIHQNGKTAFIHFSGFRINRAFAGSWAPSIVREEKTNLKIKKAKKKRRGVSSAIPMISPPRFTFCKNKKASDWRHLLFSVFREENMSTLLAHYYSKKIAKMEDIK